VRWTASRMFCANATAEPPIASGADHLGSDVESPSLPGWRTHLISACCFLKCLDLAVDESGDP
jgi:hypothetical protein